MNLHVFCMLRNFRKVFIWEVALALKTYCSVSFILRMNRGTICVSECNASVGVVLVAPIVSLRACFWIRSRS